MAKKTVLLHRAQEEELLKCVQNPIWFIKNYLEIQHPDKGRLPFDLYPFQEDVITNLLSHRFNIVLKSRQLGLSTVTSAYCLWLAIFHRDKNILLIADNFRGSKNMLSKIRIAWMALPAWMLQRLDIESLESDSTTMIKFKNGSKIEALPTTQHTGRGQAASFVVVDEAAINEKLEEGWKSIYSTVQTGGRIIVFSTPLGKSGQFFKLWMESLSGKNSFHRQELPWHVHPEHNEEWFKEESRNMDERQIAQELLCSFESSGNTFFNIGTIEWLNSVVQHPAAFNGPNSKNPTDLWIWKTPIAGHKYVIGADVARGDAEDSSAFYVIDTNENEIVAEYFGKIPPDRYGEFLVKIGEQYNNAFIVHEKNTVGVATSIKLRDLNYPNLYYPDIDEMAYLTEEEKSEKLPGFTTKTGNVPGNREELLGNLEEILRNHKIKIHSSRFADQTTYFNWNGKRGQAAKGKSDDLIMALAITCYIAKPNGTFGQQGNSMADWNKAFLASIGRSSRTISTNMGSYGQQTTMNNAVNSLDVDPMGQGSFQFRPPSQAQYYNGVKLKPGVQAAQVAQQQTYKNMFGWLDS